jgi:hypothetical protein
MTIKLKQLIEDTIRQYLGEELNYYAVKKGKNIWGVGKSETEARKNALHNIQQNYKAKSKKINSDEIQNSLKIVRVHKRVYNLHKN